MYLCWKWVMCLCLVVFGCVWVELVCVVFVVLLLASVLASMRWLLCGGDGSKKKKNLSFLKKSRERIYLHYGFN